MIPVIKTLWHGGLRAMDVIMHLGAHRCATTSFQTYLDQNRARLAANGMALWTPYDTRCGLFDGVTCPPGQGDMGQCDVVRDTADSLDADQLIISEENMIGAPRNNLALDQLYPTARHRLQRFQTIFGSNVKRVGLAIRSYESYWVSVLSFAAMRGEPLPEPAKCATLAVQPRSWTHLVKDIRTVFPHALINVWSFETFASEPHRQFQMLTGRQDVIDDLDQTQAWKNASRTVVQLRHRLKARGRLSDLALLPQGDQSWMPFSTLERQHMAAQFEDDLTYLRSGADPKITFTENAATKVLRSKNTRASPAFDTGEHYGPQAKMG